MKAVVFDLDGTLTNTLESLAYVGNKTLESLGLEARPMEEYKYFAGDGVDTLIKRFLMAAGDLECENYKKAYEFFMTEFTGDCTYKVEPYEGIKETLVALKEKGMKLAVLSNKIHPKTVEVVYKFFGENTFDIIQGQMDGLEKKPHPEGALQISKRLGIDVSEIMYVGDTDVDMKTGTSAGMFTVGVLWGFREEDELVENGANKIISHPSELLDLI